MKTSDLSILSEEMPQQLARVLSDITNIEIMQNFLRDVMTEKEITEISARFEAAKMLTAGESYTKVIARTKLSSRTVARISDWLQNGTGGYAAAMQTLEHLHAQPDSSV
jgi:TrpR-related protein YerC/YecD